MKYFKNKSIIIFAFLVVALVMQSCSDFLEQEPGTQVSITEQLATKEGVLQAVKGMYRTLEGNVRTASYATYADVQGGNIKFTPSRTGSSAGQITVPSAIENVYSFNDLSDESVLAYFYSNSYNLINQANLLLEFTDALTDATEAEKNQIKAEALTVRAYAHFLLSQVYGQNYSFTDDASHLGIVYTSESLINGIKYPARETVANTYTFIIDDITTALSLYSDTQILNGPAYSYFTATSAKALLSRVYLTKNDWQKAYDVANDIISNSGVNLVSSADYIAQWEQADLPVSEILLEFSIPRTEEGGSSGSMSAIYGYTSSTSYGNYVASEDLINLYETADIRKQLFLVQPIKTTVDLQSVDLNYYFTKKFQGNPGYVAFRLSEQYLIRAEAALKLNNLNQAKDDINVIRARVNATLLTETNNLEDELFLERRKELCFEGHLFYDIARNHKNVNRVDGCISVNCEMTYPSTKYVLPIPRNNININPNLKQNELY